MERFRVLVIDDEPSVADALRLILEDEGYEVATACCAREGLARHARLAFDLVITDLNLPDLSGLEVLGRLRASPRPCRVAVITSQCTQGVAESARRLGALATIQKPFLPSEITGLARLARRGDEADPAD